MSLAPKTVDLLTTVLDAQFTSLLPESAEAQHLLASVQVQLESYRASWSEHNRHELIATFDGPARAVKFACALRVQVERSAGHAESD